MINQSSIFLRRQDKNKILGGVRYASASLTSRQQISKNQKPFKFSKNHFQKKLASQLYKFDLKNLKHDKQSNFQFNQNPQVKSSRPTKFKFCNSKNVCVVSNLKTDDNKQSLKHNPYQKKDLRLIRTDYKKSATWIIRQDQRFSPRMKKSQCQNFSQVSNKKLKMRKASSILNCKSEIESSDKVFDRWENEDMRQDHDIIFYK